MKSAKKIHIGTCGWHYSHWKGPFYPASQPKKEFLRYYADHFQTVEINNSFYQLPKKETLAAWRNSVPAGFIFTVKASRYITHMKKLKDPSASLNGLLKVVEVLGDKLGPILFQLPPRWRFDPQRLSDFLDSLPHDYRYALEFRDTSWFNSHAYEMMSKHGVAFCIYELAGLLSPKEVTTDFIYIRLHGPAEEPYRGQYDSNVLAGWAGALSTWASQGKEIFCYFDNDEAGYAAQDALRLQEMLAKNE
jgi:uncharacterized protein YecE (DUF72 family)